MKKNNFWFSFAEIVVVISLFITIWIFSVWNFGKNFDKEILKMDLNILTNLINDLDDSILKDITDYEIHLDKEKKLFYYTTNNIYNDKKVALTFNSYSWIIRTNDSSSNTLILKIYYNNKLIKTQISSSTWSFEYLFLN